MKKKKDKQAAGAGKAGEGRFFLKEMDENYHRQHRLQDSVLRFILPDLSETSLFLMALTVSLLVATDRQVIRDWLGVIKDPQGEKAVAVVFILLVGLVWIFYHAFSKKKKSQFAKVSMLAFAVLANAAAGVASAFHLLDGAGGLFSIPFSLVNFITAFLLFYCWWTQKVNEEEVPDGDALPMQIVWSGMVLVGIFALCRYLFRLHWVNTFSICIAHASYFNRILEKRLLRRRDGL